MRTREKKNAKKKTSKTRLLTSRESRQLRPSNVQPIRPTPQRAECAFSRFTCSARIARMPPWSSLVLVAGLIVAVLLLIYGAQTAMREVGGAEQLGSALLFESAVAAARSCPPAGPVYFSRKGEVSCPLHELDFPIQSANIELDPKIWSYLEVGFLVARGRAYGMDGRGACSAHPPFFRLRPALLSRRPRALLSTTAAAPLKWKMMVFPSSKDWISQSATVNNGNQMFENFLKVFFYQALHPTNGTQVPESPLIIDVGANIGIHTLFFGALGYRTHAFEPVKATYALLACSVASNENMHSIVRVNNFGLSDKLAVGQCFGVQEGNQGHAYVDKGNKCDPSLTTSMTTMDFYWNAVLRRERPFLIKADIEGYEPFFFRGATEMLKTAPPVHGREQFALRLLLYDYQACRLGHET
ncbi:MAG: S-adenosyl-L-methionine-dependent methyltransferase [Olpidium bornovanus]|uniref:S-adenosyl-L-methionine-dependent methyltransferase n=1 Tax=Olpidium bornovanus TaxID=278681 RepID=A0A8H7ZUY8_9FUNG|nr:MAG: S-adenosyl-L-methionine-dependent methyltransferase [Olpidium bornovanus]